MMSTLLLSITVASLILSNFIVTHNNHEKGPIDDRIISGGQFIQKISGQKMFPIFVKKK
jgi:hypothetical protein